MRSYDFSDPAIQWDRTWRMEPAPYPPEPSYQFLAESGGNIRSILEIWVAYFEALFFFAQQADLLGSAFGQVWHAFCWTGDNDDDWQLNDRDIGDALAILQGLRFYGRSGRPKQVEGVFLPDIPTMESVRAHIIRFLVANRQNGVILYFRHD